MTVSGEGHQDATVSGWTGQTPGRDPRWWGGGSAAALVPAPGRIEHTGRGHDDPDPGIQAHGFILGVDLVSGLITIVSGNLAGFVGVEPVAALGATLGEVLGAEAADRLWLPGTPGELGPPVQTIRLPPSPGAGRSAEVESGRRPRWQDFEVVTYRSGDRWVGEFEPAADSPVPLRSLYDTVRRTLDDPRTDNHPRTVDAVTAQCAAAAAEIRALTGYDRVLVYRLDDPDHGEVIADAHRRGLADYRGQGVAPDAVLPARLELSPHLRMRMITDVDAPPIPLLRAVSTGPPPTAQVDLTTSLLRAPSAADQRYLRELGARALLTVPLVIDGRLWGLLACHHLSPRRVPHDVRAVCDLLARLLSWEVRAAQLRIEDRRLSRLGGFVVEVVTALTTAVSQATAPSTAAVSLTAAALEVADALLAMTAADGVVLHLDGIRGTAGRTPDSDDLDRLLPLIDALAGDGVRPWATEQLSVELGRHGHGDLAGDEATTGVLYLPFAGRDSGYVLWLRGGQARTAADRTATDRTGEQVHHRPPQPSAHPIQPQKADLPAGSARVLGGRSRPWLAAERAAAEAFAHAVPALLLHRARTVLVEHQLTAAADRQRLEHQLHQQQRLESLGQLAGGVAHDVNNLLAVIGPSAEVVTEEIEEQIATGGDSRWVAVHTDLTHITTATRRAADLTRQLLTFARREVVHPQALDLDAVITNLGPLLRRTIGDHIDLTTDLAGDLDLILADPGQIEQILVNLTINARDAMATGGCLSIETQQLPRHRPPVRPRRAPRPARRSGAPELVPVAASPPQVDGDRAVLLRVRDTGTGMTQDVIDRVFEPFFTTKTTTGGTGLGLATVHGIVHQAGATITITSDPGLGTTFTVVFPPTAELPDVEPPTALTPRRGGGQVVLVVDDNDDVRDITARVLIRAGYTVMTAATGAEALDLATAAEPPVDLLLTDLNMPGIPGDDLAAAVRTLHPTTRVLLMSGNPELLPRTGTPRPDHRVLDKPYTRVALLAAVTAALHGPSPTGRSTPR